MYKVDFINVTTVGLEKAIDPISLAGLRANEARYFKNKYDTDFNVERAENRPDIVEYVNKILEERDIKIIQKPLEVSQFIVNDIKISYIFYDAGLSINVMYDLDNPKRRAVGFKLCQTALVPKELEDKFKFARQKSRLAGVIRGSFFVIKKEYA